MAKALMLGSESVGTRLTDSGIAFVGSSRECCITRANRTTKRRSMDPGHAHTGQAFV